jgi:hypothetical protein
LLFHFVLAKPASEQRERVRIGVTAANIIWRTAFFGKPISCTSPFRVLGASGLLLAGQAFMAQSRVKGRTMRSTLLIVTAASLLAAAPAFAQTSGQTGGLGGLLGATNILGAGFNTSVGAGGASLAGSGNLGAAGAKVAAATGATTSLSASAPGVGSLGSGGVGKAVSGVTGPLGKTTSGLGGLANAGGLTRGLTNIAGGATSAVHR